MNTINPSLLTEANAEPKLIEQANSLLGDVVGDFKHFQADTDVCPNLMAILEKGFGEIIDGDYKNLRLKISQSRNDPSAIACLKIINGLDAVLVFPGVGETVPWHIIINIYDDTFMYQLNPNENDVIVFTPVEKSYLKNGMEDPKSLMDKIMEFFID